MTKKYKVLVLLPLTEQQQNQFRDVSNLDYDFCPNGHTDSERIAKAEIIIGNPRPGLLKNAKNLKWLQLISAGADRHQGSVSQEFLLTSASGAYGEAQSEFMISMLLSLYKRLHIYRDQQNEHVWKDLGCERMLCDATALVVGMGDIGTHFAKRLKAFGVYVIGVRKSNTSPSEYADEIYTIDSLPQLLPRADIVSLTVPSTPDSKHLMDEAALAKMKQDAVLINAGRGATVDTDALYAALQQGRLSGAALDVVETEPLPPSHPLWDLPNVIITPHVSGRNYLPCTYRKSLQLVLDNLSAYVSGKPLKNVVPSQL